MGMEHGRELVWPDPPGYREAVARWKAGKEAALQAVRDEDAQQAQACQARLIKQAAKESKVRRKKPKGPQFDVVLPSSTEQP